MVLLRGESTTVPGIDEETLVIEPGEIWPLPYRGSRYTLKECDKKIKLCWTRLDIIHSSNNIPNGLIKAMVKYRGDTRGSFRITPHKEVITKKKLENGNWQPMYIGKIEGIISFPGFDLNPINIVTGNLWRGLHFKHGEEFAVWNRDGNDDYLYWARKGVYFRTIDKYPDLCAKIREIRPRCGRIYITEFDHIWMNLHGNEISYEWSGKIKKLLEQDKQMLSSGNDILLKSIVARLDATQTYPIYLGKVEDFDSGIAPRTHFSSGAIFGSGGEDIDDGDEYHADSWKRMKRDN